MNHPKQILSRRPQCLAFTLAELLVVLSVLAVGVCLLLPALAGTNNRALRVQCSANLKQVGVAFHVWANDNFGYTPQAFAGNVNYPLLAGLTTGWPTTQNAPSGAVSCPNTYLVYASMSNELNTPKICVCPADDRAARTNFSTDFGSLTMNSGGKNNSVSYFAGRDVYDKRPQMFLDGDRNIASDTTAPSLPNNGYGISPDATPGSPSRGATVGFPTNNLLTTTYKVGFTFRTHQNTGNVGLMDGSVQQFSNAGLVQALVHSGDTGTSSGAPNVLLFP